MATDPAVQAAESAAELAFFQARMDHMAPVWDCVIAAVHASLAAVTPLIRAQAFTEAADMLEASRGIIGCARAIDPVLIDLQVVAHNPVQGEAMHKVIGYTAACYCAGLVRGLGEETASVDSKINRT